MAGGECLREGCSDIELLFKNFAIAYFRSLFFNRIIMKINSQLLRPWDKEEEEKNISKVEKWGFENRSKWELKILSGKKACDATMTMLFLLL